MSSQRNIACILAGALALLSAGTLWAQGATAPPPPPLPQPVTVHSADPVAAAPKSVTNMWVDTEIRQVMQDISAQTDTVILCDQTVQGVISLTVKDMPLKECLERVCAPGGLSSLLVKDYYIVGRAEPGSPLFGQMAEPFRVKLSYLLPEQIRALLPASMAPYTTYDKASGSVVVTAPEVTRKRILETIKLIDQPNQQVAIEAVVFELTEEGSKDLALDWQFKAGQWSGGSNNLVGTIAYGVGTDLGTYVDLTLRAIVQSRRGQVLANPRVLVLSNTEAEIFVGQEKYFSLLSGQASNPYYTLQSIKSGVTLKVAPYISEDGQITLGLEPEVSDVVTDDTVSAGSTQQNGASALPVVTRRHAKTVISIRDGQSVLLGGLLKEQNRSIVSKVPMAGDVPGLGAAFRKVSGDKQQQEVVILITAHVVDPRRAGAEKLASRLERGYVTPLDAIAAPYQGSNK